MDSNSQMFHMSIKLSKCQNRLELPAALLLLSWQLIVSLFPRLNLLSPLETRVIKLFLGSFKEMAFYILYVFNRSVKKNQLLSVKKTHTDNIYFS